MLRHLEKSLADIAVREKRRMRVLRPQSGPQSLFLKNSAQIAIYGGAAGSGKTVALLMTPLYYVHLPQFAATIFRRTYPEIKNAGGLWSESLFYYTPLGANPNWTALKWIFPSGASVQFSHLQKESSVRNHDGAQIALIGFDEVQSFSDSQFWYLLSRNRSVCPGVVPHIRATCNPEPNWLKTFLSWWIDKQTGLAIAERSGKIRWMFRDSEDLVWGNSREDLISKYPDAHPISVSFISASIYDNKILLEADPHYLHKLESLHPIHRKRLLEGNWNVKEGSGEFVSRYNLTIAKKCPATFKRVCRFWDFAATERDYSSGGSNPCSTASVKIGLDLDDNYWILDSTNDRMSPGQTNRKLVEKAKEDGRQCAIRWEKEPGSSGKRDAAHIKEMLADEGFSNAKGVSPRKDKISRFWPFAIAVHQGKVFVLARDWTEQLLDLYHCCPDIERWRWDSIDATSGCYNELNKNEQILPAINLFDTN